MTRRVLIIAGPNGAGKTTFAREFLPREGRCPNFVNADLIAAGLAPFNPESAAVHAGRLMPEEIQRHVAQGNTFAFETTLSGRTYAKMISDWKAGGYRVEVYFIRLDSAQMAQARVRARVRQGGHDIRPEVIERRFVAGWKDFQSIYRPLAEYWELYDNSGNAPVLIECQGDP